MPSKLTIADFIRDAENKVKADQEKKKEAEEVWIPRPDNLVLDPNFGGKASETFKTALESLVVGQGEAIQQLTRSYQMIQAGMAPPNRPMATFLYLGPTGVGKTKMVESLAEVVHGSSESVIKIDCGEYQHGHEIAKLIGSPPGYLGHKETHPLLSQDVLTKVTTDKFPYSIVLFDEIEKASDTLWNLLLGVLDKGILTLGDNRKVDFSKSLIFLTSNLGAREMSAAVSPGVGFFSPASASEADLKKRMTSIAVGAAKKKFTPEFINRLDHIIRFSNLSEENLGVIFGLELAAIQKRTNKLTILVDEAAKKSLISDSYSQEFGARFMKRTLQREIVEPLANLSASKQLLEGESVEIRLVEKKLIFVRTLSLKKEDI